MKFHLVKAFLCFYSGYFNSLFHSAFREADEGSVTLPTEDPYIFVLFSHWILTRRFYHSTQSALEPYEMLSFATLAKLWVFGDAHEVPLLQNTVIDALAVKIMTLGWIPTPSVLDFI